MIVQEQNFLTEYELKNLLEIMDYKLSYFKIPDYSFYEWCAINPEDPIYGTVFFQSIIKKQLYFLNERIEKRDWKINYVGFAYQTEGYIYHADNTYSENEEDRYMGTPDENGEGFIEPRGVWIPNYVPTRIFTTVTYLNEVEGGGTHFPTHDLMVLPESKKLLGFHCDKDHIHGVTPTIRGIRKALIFWFD
jgi:hypothetical protein